MFASGFPANKRKQTSKRVAAENKRDHTHIEVSLTPQNARLCLFLQICPKNKLILPWRPPFGSLFAPGSADRMAPAAPAAGRPWRPRAWSSRGACTASSNRRPRSAIACIGARLTSVSGKGLVAGKHPQVWPPKPPERSDAFVFLAECPATQAVDGWMGLGKHSPLPKSLDISISGAGVDPMIT